AKLSFGLQGGFTQYRYDYNRLTYKTNNDPAFSATGDQNFFLPNFGFGMYYSSKTLFAGISIPQIMQHFVNSQEIAKNAIQLRYYLFYGGCLVKVSPNLVFKPSTLIKFSPGVPIQFDVNAAFLIRDALWLMLSYRTLNMVNASFQLNLNESLSVGYAYQQSLGGYSGGFGGTHEIMLNYRFKIGVSDVVNPRYF
ncbi:MAG: PorP/SprF family type IX secretion system membrane protein, partial [Cytophagales bacterium]|nr:PorP/SprF family type IX secretion system membrane protein [Cytophagales bacterium]